MNKTLTTISVIIPAYNVESYISRAIESVLAQTLPASEIIVVDDGSTDNTAATIKKYSQVNYIYQPNTGVSAARNTAIKNANSQWIALLDSDDYWEKNKLEKQIKIAQANPEIHWLTCNYKILSEIKNTSHNAYDFKTIFNNKNFFDYFESLQKNIILSPSTMLINRNIFEQTGYFDENLSYGEDIDLFIRIAHLHPQIGYTNETLAVYTQDRLGSAINNTSSAIKLQKISSVLQKHIGQNQKLNQFIAAKLTTWIYINYSQGNYPIILETLEKFNDILDQKYINLMKKMLKLPKFCRPLTQKIIRKKGYGIQQ